MSTEANKAMVLRGYEEGVNKGNVSVFDEYMAPDIVFHIDGGEYNREAFKQLVGMLRSGFPDFHASIDHFVAEGDKVVHGVTYTGTHKGSFMGLAPTGKSMKVSAFYVSRFAEGKQVEDWGVLDRLGLMQQLGAIAPTGQDQLDK